MQHPSVLKVLEIAEELTSKNVVLNVNMLYNLAKNRLKLPRKGLLAIIQLLINKKVLLEGSKFTKKSVLFNIYRKRIYNFIISNSGAHFSLIRKEAFTESESERNTASAGRLIWHLEMLLKFDYIKKVKYKNNTIFLPSEIEEKIGILHFLLRNDLDKRIMRIIMNKGPIKRSNLYKQFSEKRENIYYRIKTLLKNDIIYIMKGSTDELSTNPNLRELIEIIL